MMNRESDFLRRVLAVTLAVSAIGFRLRRCRAKPSKRQKPAPAETPPDIDIGGGFGKVSSSWWLLHGEPARAEGRRRGRLAGGEAPAAADEGLASSPSCCSLSAQAAEDFAT